MNCGQTVNILKENALRVISSAQALQSAVDSGFQYNSAFLFLVIVGDRRVRFETTKCRTHFKYGKIFISN